MKKELTEKEIGYLIGLLTATANNTTHPDIHTTIFNKLNHEKALWNITYKPLF